MKIKKKMIEKVEIIKKLKHPNLLEYISVWYEENNQKAIIITELLQGGNLNEHRKYQKKLKIKLIKKWIKQILLALDYLHSNGYIHHDIKCQNILVDRITGNLKIGDLISLEKVDEKGYFSKYIGTEEFMAPEVKQGKYTFKADIYSLGLTIIQFLTMEKPYKEIRKKQNIYEAKINGKLPMSFEQINDENIKEFISLCLKDENERPNCKELLENKWLNDKSSKDNNKCIEIINNLRQVSFLIDKKPMHQSHKDADTLINKEKIFSPWSSSKSLTTLSLDKPNSMEPIYSLDISKINSTKKNKEKKRLKKYNTNSSYIGKKTTINQTLQEMKLNLSMLNSNERKKIERDNALSERANSKKWKRKRTFFKMFKELYDSSDFIRQEGGIRKKKTCLKNQNYIIYCYIYEFEEKLYFIIKEKQKPIENTILQVKFIANNKKFKTKKLSEKEIILKEDFKNNNIEKIIDILKGIIDLEIDDILIIRNELGEQIKKIIKEKKLRDLKDKIDELINNFEFLSNNEDLDDLELLINSSNFCETNMPKDVIKKIEYYKEKKENIETVSKEYNKLDNEDINNNNYNYNINDQDILTLNINV